MTLTLPVCATCALVSVGYTDIELGISEYEMTKHSNAVQGMTIDLVSDYDGISACTLCYDITMTADADVTRAA